MEPLLRLRGIERRYATGGSDIWALRGVDLDIYSNDFVAIVGPSGGGKSTLLSIVGLLDEPTVGEYMIQGENTGSLNDTQVTSLRARTFGFIFQAFHLLENRRIRDSAELAVLYKGYSPAERRVAAQTALDSLGLGERSESPANVLSGGQRQRVAIARAIATNNPVVLADEPTGNLDSVSGAAVLEELKRLHADGATVIVVTHSTEVARTASRVVRITDGRLTEEYTTPDENRGSSVRAPEGASKPAGGKLRVADVFRDALASLFSRRRDAVARVAAVAIAVALTVVTLGLSSSAAAQVTSSFDARTNLEVTVQWPDQGARPSLSLEAAVERARDVIGVDSAAAISDLGEIEAGVNGSYRSTTLHGGYGDIAVSTGSNIDWVGGAERPLHSGEVLIGASLATQLGIAPLAASPTVTLEGRQFVVVGVIEESRRFPRLAGEIVMLDGDARGLGREGQTTLAILTDQGAAQQVGKRISVSLDPFVPEQFVVDVPIDPKALRQEVESGVQVALAAFSVLAALAAVFTLSSAISASVFARRSEFGLRRAVGARAHHLALLVTSESVVVGALGGVAGLLLGMISILVFTIVQRWIPVFDWALAPLALASGMVLAILSSVAGALRAARTRPSDALRS